MKYSQLTEGVIKVPPSLMSTLNKYVASTICTQLYNNIETVQKVAAKLPEKAEAQLKRINQVISYLKNTYGAVILNDNTYNAIVENDINIPLNFSQFFNELNMPVTPENKRKIINSSLNLSVRRYIPNGSEGSLSHDTDLTTFLITIKSEIDLAPLDENIFARCKDAMSSVYHEAQHYIQSNVLARINPNQKQLQAPKNQMGQNSTHQDYSDYLTSGVEYSPWMGDIMNSVITEIEIMKADGTLPTDGLNKIFMKLIIKVTSDDKKAFGKFLYEIYKKDPNQYKDTMKKIFKMVQPAYDSIKNADTMEVAGDLKQEYISIDFNVMGSLIKELKPAVEKDGGEFTAYGRSIDSITRILIKYPNYNIEIKPLSDKEYMYTMSSNDGISNYSRNLPQTDALQLATVLKRYGDDEEMTYSAIEQTKADAKFGTEVIEDVFKRVSALNEKYNSEKPQYTSSEIVIGGLTYEVKPDEKYYHLSSPELVLLDAYLKNSVSLSQFLQEIVYTINRTSASEVQYVLEDCFSEYDAIKALRNM